MTYDTFHGWKARGFHVKKGQRHVKLRMVQGYPVYLFSRDQVERDVPRIIYRPYWSHWSW